MSPVTDSLMASPIFKELCEMHKLKDSADEHYNREHLLTDIDPAISNLTLLRDKAMKLL